MFDIVRIAPEFAEVFRRVRLEALRTDPLAFGSTYEKEVQLSPEDWLKRAESLDGIQRIGFFLMRDREVCGLGACFRDDQNPTIGQVISIWVSPSSRRAGLGIMLLEAIRSWAESQGITKLLLMVASGNSGAIELYRRAGFSETGLTKPYPNDPTLMEIEMSRSTAQEISAKKL